MFTKTKTVLAAAFIVSAASAAFAQSSGEELQNSQYLRNPNAGVPLYTMNRAPALIEGRNVAVQTAPRVAPRTWTSQDSFGGY